MTLAADFRTDERREVALLKAIGFDRLAPEQRELALNIANRYELDPLLKHLVLIEGRVYITRDGLLHTAHRSGALDGIVLDEGPTLDGDYWRATVSVYRKDMSHPFRYAGRYPAKGGNAKFAPEMAVKVAEVMALRRAFDVAAPAAEERWDTSADVDVPAPVVRPSLAETVAVKAAVLLNPDEVAEGAEPFMADMAPDPDEAVWAAAKAAITAPLTDETPIPVPTMSRIEFMKRTGMGKVAKDEIAKAHAALGMPVAADMTDADWGRLAVELGLA